MISSFVRALVSAFKARCELALEWVHWYNTQRLLEPIGNVEAIAIFQQKLDLIAGADDPDLCLLFIHPRDGDHGYTQPERAPGGRAVSGRTLQPLGPHRSMTGVDSTSLATSWSVSRYERRTKEERHPFEAC